MPTGSTDAIVGGPPIQENDVKSPDRFVTHVPESCVSGFRQDETKPPRLLPGTFQEEFAAFRRDVEDGFTGLENAIKELKPASTDIDPTTNFWTVYQKAADEYDSDLLDRYARDLDTSLLFAGLFSAVTTAFIVQINPLLQPNPTDLTNVLLLRMLQQNDSFGELNPLAPVLNVSSSVIKAQSTLFASLAVTLFVAFITVLGKQWTLYYQRASAWGGITDRGKERRLKFLGPRTWRLHIIIPVLLQIALLLFSAGVVIYLWGLDPSAAQMMLAVSCTGFLFYAWVSVVATIRPDFPFQTPVSIFLRKVFSWAKQFVAYARTRLRRWSAAPSWQIETSFIGPLYRAFYRKTAPDQVVEDAHDPMKLSNPAFWRQDPLFTSPLPKHTAASAGFWLLENSADSSAASAVAGVFFELQWQPHHHSETALIRLHDTYKQCFRVHRFDRSARLQALRSAAAYYVLYHTWLIRSASKSRGVEVEKPPNLPSDLLLHKSREEWHGYDLFEYLLHFQDCSEPVTSARFLSYIAPYWFCGDSDFTIRFRPGRLETLYELITVLKSSKALVPTTLTDCVLCVGAAMGFPLHPEDLIRVDKRHVPLSDMSKAVLIWNSEYLASTFKTVVQHICDIALVHGHNHDHAAQALDILLTLTKDTRLPLVGVAWINELLKQAAGGGMADEEFTLLLRLSARRVGGFGIVNPRSLGTTATWEFPTQDGTLFGKVVTSIRTHGWQEEAVYGGLLAIRDIRLLGSSLFDDDALQTFHEALNHGNPLHIRQAAYDAMLVTRGQWLRSENLRQRLGEFGLFRQLHHVVVKLNRSDYQRSFLMMVEILSEDAYWRSYLREDMGIWLSLRDEGMRHALRILANVGGLPLPMLDDLNPLSFDRVLQRMVLEEWERVPKRHARDLTADRLKPLVEVTEQFKELLFDRDDQRAVLAKISEVAQHFVPPDGDSYDGPGGDVRGIVDDLVAKLQ